MKQKRLTPKQQKGARLLANYLLKDAKTGKQMTLKTILEEAGYSLSSANQAGTIIKGDGFRRAYLAEMEAVKPELLAIQKDLIADLKGRNYSKERMADVQKTLIAIHNILRLEQDLSTQNKSVQVIRQDFSKAEIDEEYVD